MICVYSGADGGGGSYVVPTDNTTATVIIVWCRVLFFFRFYFLSSQVFAAAFIFSSRVGPKLCAFVTRVVLLLWNVGDKQNGLSQFF